MNRAPWEQDDTIERVVKLTPASSITVRPVRWLWALRLALGTLGLLAGREGIGKSILAYTLAALITRGRLDGEGTSASRGPSLWRRPRTPGRTPSSRG